jgi:hypothetical protein
MLFIVSWTGAALTLVVAAAVTLGRDDIADAIYGDGISSGISTWGIGDAAGAGLWAVALYFCSPLQLLLLFLGKIDTERPSDFVLRQLGVLTQQKYVGTLPVVDIDMLWLHFGYPQDHFDFAGQCGGLGCLWVDIHELVVIVQR